MTRTTPMHASSHIVAMGGGGFSMEPGNPLLDDFVLSLVNKDRPRLCFVPTASADSQAYLVKFYRALSHKSIASDLTLFDPSALPRNPPTTAQLQDFVRQQDIIYVGGGNTVNLLAMWRAHGLDRIFRDALADGIVLCGISAGMICWFKDGLTDSFGSLAPMGDGLGYIDASACPHYDGEPGRPAAYRQAIEDGMPSGFAADDGAALHFTAEGFKQAIASRPDAKAYRVDRVDGKAAQTPLDTHYLGGL